VTCLDPSAFAAACVTCLDPSAFAAACVTCLDPSAFKSAACVTCLDPSAFAAAGRTARLSTGSATGRGAHTCLLRGASVCKRGLELGTQSAPPVWHGLWVPRFALPFFQFLCSRSPWGLQCNAASAHGAFSAMQPEPMGLQCNAAGATKSQLVSLSPWPPRSDMLPCGSGACLCSSSPCPSRTSTQISRAAMQLGLGRRGGHPCRRCQLLHRWHGLCGACVPGGCDGRNPRRCP